MNRFQLLNMDDDESDSLEDEDENDTSGVSLPSFLKASPTSIATWERSFLQGLRLDLEDHSLSL